MKLNSRFLKAGIIVALAMQTAVGLRAQQALAVALEPELDGDEVQRVLGIAQGRDVGAALKFLLELRLDEGMLGPAAARRRLQDWWSSRA